MRTKQQFWLSVVVSACCLVAGLHATPAAACDGNKEPKQRIEACQKLLKQSGQTKANIAITLSAIAAIYLETNNLDIAMEYARRAIAADAKSSLGYSARGMVWTERGDIPRAIKDFDQALNLPAIAEIRHVTYLGRGTAYWRLEEREKALADFDRLRTCTMPCSFNDLGLFCN